MMKRNTITRTLGVLTVLFIAAVTNVSAQISVHAKPAKNQFIAYEPVKLNLTITNRAGQPIRFQNTSKTQWVEFVVEHTNGSAVHQANNVSYKSTTIPTGQSMTSAFTISNTFDLTQPGNYSAYARVRMPGQGITSSTRSNKVHFTIIKGYVSWRQRAGVPGKAGHTREFRIMGISGGGKSELYVQVEDVKKGKMLATYSMGRNLSFRQFTATLDRASNLHVLFLTTPELHCHTVVSPNGKTIRREYHKKSGASSAPKLITTSTGTVGVINSRVYDPAKEKEKRKEIHNLSELPGGITQ